MKLKSYRFYILRIVLCAALLGANVLPGAAVVRAASPATSLPQRQDRAGDSFAPEAPASTGGTFIVNGYGVDTPAYDLVLTLQEALLLVRGGTGPNGLGRALYDSERQQIFGCTFGGSAGAWTLTAGAGCGAGVTDTIVFDMPAFATITETTPIPLINDSAPTIVDGSSAFPIINTSGVGAGHNGLHVSSNGNTLKAFAIVGSPNDNFYVDGSNNLLDNVWANGAGGDGIYLSGDGNTVDHSYAGFNSSYQCLGNGAYGIGIAAGSQNNTVQNSHVGCNASSGIVIMDFAGSGGHTIGPNNSIGTNPSGSVNRGNGLHGLLVSSNGNSVLNNTIAFNSGDGLAIARNSNSVTGNSVLSNTLSGMRLYGTAQSNAIGCSAFCLSVGGNRLAANMRYGIEITGTAVSANFVEANQIGVDASGTISQPNVAGGMLLWGAHNNIVGDAGARGNDVAGNAGDGIRLDGSAHDNTFTNNSVGAARNGGTETPLGNGGRGLFLLGGAHNNTFGTSGLDGGNLIEYNVRDGVLLDAAAHNTFDNNLVNANLGEGIWLRNGSHDNVIGSSQIWRNKIMLNHGDGVAISGLSYSNTVAYNQIGLDITDSDAGNVGFGVSLSGGAYGNHIGVENQSFYSNNIEFNHAGGVGLDGSTTTTNTVFNNWIILNLQNGIQIVNGAHDNVVESNSIHHSPRHGILLTGAGTSGNVISDTQIYDNLGDGINEGGGASNNWWTKIATHENAGLGIDTSAGDDSNNFVTGPFPRISSAVYGGGNVTIMGKASPLFISFQTVKVEVYWVAADASGYGEGLSYAGAAQTNFNGDWSLTIPSVAAGCFTAFQTVTNLTTGTASSSEFGPNSCRLFLPLVVR